MKKRKMFYMVVFGILLGCLLAVGYWRHSVSKPGAVAKLYRRPPAGHRVRIEGLRFYSINEGCKVLSLEAASFVIEKKRLGFFRLALANTARITGGKITIFDELPKGGNADKSGSATAATGRQSGGGTGPTRFPQLLSPALLKDFPVPLGRIAAIEVEPITLTIMEGNTPATSITATSAEIRLKNKEIRFAGNVRVMSGSKTLETDELTFDPGQGLLKTDRAYRMMDGRAHTSGQRLQTDIFLRS